MNEIRVSFDQQRAVRIGDGLQLVAVPDSEGRCVGCDAGDHESWPDNGVTCSRIQAADPLIRCCNSAARKDKRNIVWRPA